MSNINLSKLPKAPEFLEKALTPASREIGKTLGNIFYIVFNRINYSAEKLRIKQLHYLKKFEQDIQKELYKVPEEKLIDPPLNIVGPALEASKFYIEQEELRKMFAKLIASSMNIDLTNYSHPSFIEIIKQLSPIEAHIVKYLSKNSFLPYVKLTYKGSGDNLTVFPIMEPYTKIRGLNADYSIIASSLKNLQRLGLISFLNIVFCGDKVFLQELMSDKVFDGYNNLTKTLNEQNLRLENGELNVESGNISLTTYGIRFSKTCI